MEAKPSQDSIVQCILDGREGSIDSRCVGDDVGVFLVLGHVEVHTNEDQLVLEVHLVDLRLGQTSLTQL